MKKLLSLPVHQLIFWVCFLPWLIFILLYELWFSEIPASSELSFKSGIIFAKIGYSIVAASIFYFVSQYIGVYIPRERKKIIILPFVYAYGVKIDNILAGLKLNLKYQGMDITDSNKFRDAINKINTDSPIDNFENWYHYLYHIKTQIWNLTRGMIFHHEFLSREYLEELLTIEQRLASNITFVGYKVLAVSNLSYAEIDLQELLLHNQYLQKLREVEFKKYNQKFAERGKEYRKANFGDNNNEK
jgi:hypothetical protein